MLWVDGAYESIQKIGFDVCDVAKIMEAQYDFILLAVKEESMAISIKKDLVKMGVLEEKILWKKPETIY